MAAFKTKISYFASTVNSFLLKEIYCCLTRRCKLFFIVKIGYLLLSFV